MEYKNLNIGKKVAEAVTKQEMENEINNLLQQRVTYQEKESKAALGDIVNIDFEGFIDNVAFEGGKGEKYDLKLGSNSFIPGFEDQLVGHKKGEEVDVNVTFPEQYHAENLKGKAAIFKCKIHAVKTQIVPEFNDEFAKNNGYGSAEELKKVIENHLYSKKQNELNNQYVADVCEYIIANNHFDIDDQAKNKKIEEILKYYENSVAQYGMTLDAYLNMSGMTLDAFKTQLEPEAIKALKVDVIYDYIAKEEKITLSDEEIDKELNLLKAYYGLSDQQLNKFKEERMNDFKLDMLRQKVSVFILENNN